MPMCDAYIPAGALPADAEREMLFRVSEILIHHEMRRTVDLVEGLDVNASTEAARSIGWISVLRHEPYVASAPAQVPYYKFVVHVPEGQADDELRAAVTRDITQAVVDAEAGKWPSPELRVWVLTWEVPDGTWGAAGHVAHLGDVVAYLAPELSEPAIARLAARRRDQARTLLAAAGVEPVASS
jgi:phenylpyruvate tautomerase PptA (4-oxalocrotonate tautomerase family)